MTRARRLSSLLAAAAALALVACGGSDGSGDSSRLEAGQALTLESSQGLVKAEIHVEGSALVEGKNAFGIHFDPDTTELLGARGLMLVHGHGFAKPPVIERTDDGGYQMSNAVFYMSGLWKVMLDLQVDDSDDRVEFTVDIP